jgi:hypothetical protein
MNTQNRNLGIFGVGLGILFPLFFKLDGSIYRDVNQLLDSQGMLARLPFPVSILTCLVALVFLAGRLGRARPAIAMIVGTMAVSVASLWLGSDGVTSPGRKVIMILQVVLPLAGLLLGQLVDDKNKLIARAFLVVLSVVVPLQLLATILQDSRVLTHYLYGFSIYSHQQYVTLIFVCAFAYSLTSLWDEYRLWLCMMILIMFVYITRSFAFLTIFAFGSLLFAFAASKLWAYRMNAKSILASLALIAAVILGGLAAIKITSGQGYSDLFAGKFAELAEGKLPSNVEERFNDWKTFGNGIIESNKTILVGHPQPMPREIRTSPHNWYIDIVYNFGVVSLLPIVALMGYTVILCRTRRRVLPAETWWLAAIVFYLVVIDSNFKVTLRQPYPGIFAYFMWGLLLSGLRAPAEGRRSV